MRGLRNEAVEVLFLSRLQRNTNAVLYQNGCDMNE